MKKIKELSLPIIIAIGLFLVISIAYMYPALEGKNVSQHDITQHIGMSKEIVDYRTETGFGFRAGIAVVGPIGGGTLSVIKYRF